MSNIIYYLLSVVFFLTFCLFFSFEDFLDLLRIVIWPSVLLLGAFHFKRVFTYAFLSFEEFNFFGLKGKLKDVREVIDERARTKFNEMRSAEKMESLKIKEKNIEELKEEIEDMYVENFVLKDELKDAKAKLDAFGRLLTELEGFGSIKITDANIAFGTTTPTSGFLVPGPNQVLWQTVFTVANRPVFLKKIKFRIKELVTPTDLGNTCLFIDDIEVRPFFVGKTNNEIEIDLTKEPVALSTGSRVISLRSNVNSNAKGKHFTISVLPSEDLELIDSNFLNKINLSLNPGPLESSFSIG